MQHVLQVLNVRTLCAPNLWHSHAVLQAEVAAQPIPVDRLTQLISHWEGTDHSSFLAPQPGFPTAAHALLKVAQLLQRLTDGPCAWGMIRPANFRNVWNVVFEIENPSIGRATLDAAARVLDDDQTSAGPLRDEILADYRQLVKQHRCGHRTRHLIREAMERGIPVLRLNDESLLQLGQGRYRQRLQTAVTERTSLLAETVSRDKQLCRELMDSVGLPVVEGTIAADPEMAVRFAEELQQPVVVKPRDADYGNGVSLNLRDPVRIRVAWHEARLHSSDVIVERFQPGDWYRLFVVGGRVVAAAQRRSPKLTGDGQHTIADLIIAANTDPRRGTEPGCPLEPLRVGVVELAVLYRQSLGLDSIPAPGREVFLRDDAYLATGATQIDVTDSVHPEAAALAVEAAALIGLDVAGVDVISTDLSRPLAEQSLSILEVNAEPAFTMHLAPYSIPSRPVPQAILATLFPAGTTGRLPLVAVYAEVPVAMAATRQIESVETMTAFVTTNSWQLGRRAIRRKRGSLGDNLRAVWLHPQCAASVVNVTDHDMESEGLPFDRSDVVVFGRRKPGDAPVRADVVRLLLSTHPRIVIAPLSFAAALPPPRSDECQFVFVDEGLFEATVRRICVDSIFPRSFPNRCVEEETPDEAKSFRPSVSQLCH